MNDNFGFLLLLNRSTRDINLGSYEPYKLLLLLYSSRSLRSFEPIFTTPLPPPPKFLLICFIFIWDKALTYFKKAIQKSPKKL